MLPSVIRGGKSLPKQRSSKVIRGHQRSSAVISGHQRSSEPTKAEDAGECGRCVQQGARAQDQREDCEREE